MLGWSSFDIFCVFTSQNIVLCKVVVSEGNEWVVMFVYDAPSLEDRLGVWMQIVRNFIQIS